MRTDGLRRDSEDDMLDLVDERGECIGAVRRGDCHGDPSLRHRAVHVFVKNSKGQFFLQKRSGAKKVEPGKWDTSVGGHLACGESYEEAALRELEEEIGLELGREPNIASRLQHCHDYVWRSEIETEHVRTFVVEVDDEPDAEPDVEPDDELDDEHGGPFALNRDEIEDGRFWNVDQIREAVGTGILTPNLEEELRRLGISRG